MLTHLVGEKKSSRLRVGSISNSEILKAVEKAKGNPREGIRILEEELCVKISYSFIGARLRKHTDLRKGVKKIQKKYSYNPNHQKGFKKGTKLH